VVLSEIPSKSSSNRKTKPFGKLVKNDVYVWKVTYKDVLKTYGEMLGTVTLVR